MNLDLLKRPFRPHEIDWRVGAKNKENTSGMALAYMDARAVMERLDEVCGPENWQCRYPHAGQKTCCEIGLNMSADSSITAAWVWKSDGAGDTDFEGDKGAFSDAFKRAAFRWGIGRYLYGIDTPWVPIQARGRSYVITEEGVKTLNRVYRDAIWRGPLSVVALKEEMKVVFNHFQNAGSVEDLDLLEEANAGALEQCEYDLPDWYYGSGDTRSVEQRISDKRNQLEAA